MAAVKVGEADSGRSVRLSRGSVIVVDLAPNGGSYDPPQTNDSAVLREDSHTGGYPDATDAWAVFAAVGPGTTTITSVTDVACLHTTPRCLPPQREFTLTVTVA